MFMKLLRVAVVGLGIVWLVPLAGGAQAQQPLPWGPRAFCTEGEGKDADADMPNCTFYTLEQCRASAWGNGETCMANPFYHGEPKATVPVRKHRRHG
jgi:hypothetical protein